jgi:hypothetical protein
MASNIQDPAYFVRELSSNPASNSALYYITEKLGGKIVIPLDAFEQAKAKAKDEEHPLVAYLDPQEGIILQIV